MSKPPAREYAVDPPRGSSRSWERPGERLDPNNTLYSADLSQFAKTLRAQLTQHFEKAQAIPGHVALLNMLARASGHRNVQALKARPASAAPDIPPQSVTLSSHAAKALTQFDAQGRLSRWPHKFSVQRIAMWALWMRFDGARQYSEREVNDILKAWTIYGDHVTPRRELVNMKLLGRKPDCSAYWKEAQRPSDEVRSFLRALRAQTS